MNHDPPLLRHVLITGVPGCGKTTLLKNLAHELRRFRPAGFYTEEIRLRGKRKGFRLVGLDGAVSLLADVGLPGVPRVGKYGVAVDRFEDFLNAQKLDQAASPLVFIDEIGKMECLCTRFADLVRRLLDSPKTIAATVALKGGGLIAEVKQRPDAALVEVAPGNRDRLVEDLVKRITAMVKR
jgi:nucleoside-triphosphatase